MTDELTTLADPVIDVRREGDPGPSRQERREARRRQIRRRRIAAAIGAVFMVFLLVVGVSWVMAITKAGQESFSARNAEWMRDHGLGFIVDRAEQIKYENDQPKDGGAPSKALTKEAPPVTEAKNAKVTPFVPAPMPTSASSPFPGEGVWEPVTPLDKQGRAGAYIPRGRPNAQKSSLVVFVARIDPSRAEIKLVPGTELPGGTWSHPPQVTAEECPRAALALNGGFRFDQSNGGWYSEGRVASNAPLRNGAASLVVGGDGKVNVAMWGRDVGNGDLSRLRSVRQNLTLMVDGGKVVPDIDAGPKWGARLKNSIFIWRSGYGVTADGNLVYVGGPGLTPRFLAERLIDAGAVRGMQGDINPEWVASNIINHDATGCHGTKGLNAPTGQGGQQSSADRYLSTDTRDFVEVLAK